MAKREQEAVKAVEAAARNLGLPDFVAFHGRRQIRALRHTRRRTRKAGGWKP